MNKKIIVVLVMVCMLFSAALAADITTEIAYGHAWIYTSNGTAGIPDATFDISGSGNRTSVFFVSSSSASTVTLSQTKGECLLTSYTKPLNGFTGTAQEWGKYRIDCVHLDSWSTTSFTWDNTYFNETYTLTLTAPGDYYVVVTPFTADEMTDSYLLDQFNGWTTPPYWTVTSCMNCSVYVTPSSTSTSVPPSITPPTSGGSTCPDTPLTPPEFPIFYETCYIYDDGNNVRTGPGTQYPVIGQANTGDSFVIYDYRMGSTGKDWYMISYKGLFGWISSSIVELNGNYSGTINGMPITPNPPSTTTPVPELIIWGFTNQRLSTRSGPGTNYTDMGTYNDLSNAWVQVRSRAWDDRNDIWWVEVDVGGSWVWTGYKRFDSTTLPLENIPINPYY